MEGRSKIGTIGTLATILLCDGEGSLCEVVRCR